MTENTKVFPLRCLLITTTRLISTELCVDSKKKITTFKSLLLQNHSVKFNKFGTTHLWLKELRYVQMNDHASFRWKILATSKKIFMVFKDVLTRTTGPIDLSHALHKAFFAKEVIVSVNEGQCLLYRETFFLQNHHANFYFYFFFDNSDKKRFSMHGIQTISALKRY